MLSAVLHTIARHRLFEPGDRVLVAVSGGPDSMALLAVLWELAPRLDLTLEVATVDHGLRPEAAVERALVSERATALGLACHALSVEVRPGPGRGGLQEVARRARMAALESCADARSCARVALGHQADDQAETVLFRILRGTGLRGLAGIPYRRGPLVRPLLDVSRAEILAYLRRRSLPFVDDPSNANPRFARARLRHTILPALRRENPRLDEALRRLAADAAKVTGGERTDAVSGGSPGPPEPTLEHAARRAGVHVSARLRAAVEAATRRGGSRSFDVAGGRRLTVTYGRVSVDAARAVAPGGDGPGELLIVGEGVHRLGARALSVVVGDVTPAPESDGPSGGAWAWFDSERLGWPLVLRRTRPGDRMRPRGGRGSRKVADLLIDAKVPRADRPERLVLATPEGEVLFVPGLRPSQVGAPTAETGRWLGVSALATGG